MIHDSCEVNGIETPSDDPVSFMGKEQRKPRTPNHQPVQDPSPRDPPVYIGLDDCTVGFKHWHPTPVTQNGNKLAGQGEFGGVWEWTSSPLQLYDGFKPMDAYPGYTGECALD